MTLYDHCHFLKKKGGGKRKKRLKDTIEITTFPQAYPHLYCSMINRICRIMIIIITKNKAIYYCYCPCQENIRKLSSPKKMWA